ncbi:hypothetical protein [Stenotrophomonas phage RAS14]
MSRPKFAGIGSRKIVELQPDLEPIMAAISRCLVDNNYILRSGGAIGCDLWFEAGVPNPEDKEIFYYKKELTAQDDPYFCSVDEKALAMARRIHPNWSAMGNGGKGLHARNTYQILGREHDDHVDFVLCWTYKGIVDGGTRTAIMVAREFNIPVLNFGEVTDGKFEEAFELFMLSQGISVKLSDYFS